MRKIYSLLLMCGLLFSVAEAKAEVGTEVIKIKTDKAIGSTLSMEVLIYGGLDDEGEVKTITPINGDNISFEGATVSAAISHKIYLKVNAPEITIRGNVYLFTVVKQGITEVDLTEAAKLGSLRVNENPITGIDVSKNAELVELWASYCPELQSVNLENASKLMTLSVQGSKVSSLDFTDAKAIRTLYAGDNPNLKSLNLAALGDLDELWVNGNGIESLDLSGNPYLMNLDCSRNKLTTLDVTANTDINFLSCWGNNIKGEAMDNLIKTLPQEEFTPREFCVFNGLYADEHNELTDEQIAAVKKRGWIAKEAAGSMDFFVWEELHKGVSTSIGSVAVEAEERNVWFDLNGRRIEQPSVKGIYIHNGKKVIVK
ncbi:leucine-rich repeat domain-containing protein [Prevotella sp. HUN102]|uniref:leucine-rich repeat domain-containing protein n=1 Tax=Prevotella sp. HUN102 TaxID=1392486 RepID=UPI00048ABDBB|nr:leucine-rich repeat domain-containing protein [Prevotella sp. HUN102]